MRTCYVAHGWFGVVSTYTMVLYFEQRFPVWPNGWAMNE